MKRGLIGVLLASAAACQLVAGIDGREVAPVLDAGPVDRCNHAYAPEGGASSSDPDGTQSVVLALDLTFSTKVEADGQTLGFDLDGVCSDGTGATTSCRRCETFDQDDPQGRDNAAGGVLRKPPFNLLLAQGDASAEPNLRFRLLARIESWNGTDQDPAVKVAFFRSHGAEPVNEADAAAPTKLGEDTWSVTSDSVVPGIDAAAGQAPALLVVDGAVVDGRLVARVGDESTNGLPIDFGGSLFAKSSDSRTRIDLRNAIVAIPIPRPGENVATGGVIAGRWNVDALLKTLLHLRIASFGAICVFLPQAREAVCKEADISTFARVRPDQPCDALSIVFEVEAVKAKLGRVFELPPIVDLCDAGPSFDCTSYYANPAQCSLLR